MATKATETAPAETTEVELFDGDSSATSDVRKEIAEFKTGDVSIYSTFRGDDFFATARAQLAATSTSLPLSEHLNETILLDNYVLQAVEIPDEKTGELQESIRVTLADSTNGKSYHATSVALARGIKGIVNALQGKEPSEWPEPLPVQVREERSRKGYRFMNIVVVL